MFHEPFTDHNVVMSILYWSFEKQTKQNKQLKSTCPTTLLHWCYMLNKTQACRDFLKLSSLYKWLAVVKCCEAGDSLIVYSGIGIWQLCLVSIIIGLCVWYLSFQACWVHVICQGCAIIRGLKKLIFLSEELHCSFFLIQSIVKLCLEDVLQLCLLHLFCTSEVTSRVGKNISSWVCNIFKRKW